MIQRLVDKIVFFFRVLGYGRTAILKIHITKIERISFGLFYGTLHFEKLERMQGVIDYSKAKKISIQHILSLPPKSFILFNLLHFPHSYLQSFFKCLPELWENISESTIDEIYQKCYGLEGKMSLTDYLFNNTDLNPFGIIVHGGQSKKWKITLIEQYLDFHIDFLNFKRELVTNNYFENSEGKKSQVCMHKITFRKYLENVLKELNASE
ncbi:MAG: hypothetical protein P1U56_01580 [Saprospiraceae bacterium]|nr:hypothetical protein [Saprospiraceae bacterium]